MKDINEKALALGMNEATKLLNGQLERGHIDGIKMGQVLSAITPTLSYDNVKHVDVVVEAVVENPKVKAAVLVKWKGSSAKTLCSPATPPPSPSPCWPRD